MVTVKICIIVLLWSVTRLLLFHTITQDVYLNRCFKLPLSELPWNLILIPMKINKKERAERLAGSQFELVGVTKVNLVGWNTKQKHWCKTECGIIIIYLVLIVFEAKTLTEMNIWWIKQPSKASFKTNHSILMSD